MNILTILIKIMNKSYSSNLGSGYSSVDSTMYVISDNSGYYIIGAPGNSYSQICRYLHGQSSIKCQTITSISSSIFSSLRLSSDRFYICGWAYDKSSYYTMMDVTFGSSQINWGASMKSVSNNSFTPYTNGAVLSSDKSKIYVLTPFGKVSSSKNNSNYTYTLDSNIYFLTLSATSGSVVGSIYMTDNGGYYVYGATLSGGYVVAPFISLYSTFTSFLMFFNTATSSFSFKFFLGLMYFPVHHPITDK